MKTIEERSKEYVDKNFHRIAEEMPIEKGMETIFIESAKEQFDIDHSEEHLLWIINQFGEWQYEQWHCDNNEQCSFAEWIKERLKDK